MDWQQAQKEMTTGLLPYYGEREAALITDWVMESLSGWKKIDRLLHRSDPFPGALQEKYNRYLDELLARRPVQYVLQESWFAGLKFYVDENVLIPRPETEELVLWVLETLREKDFHPTPTLLDMGTGSGCIAIALKRQFPRASLHAVDNSPAALAVARRNASALAADIHFHLLDFLDSRSWNNLPFFDTIVSNPPYIPGKEKTVMAAHVIEFEPHAALFVEDADPLVFYRALTGFARQKLLPGGSLFVEIQEDLASATLDLFKSAGFQQVILHKDMQGKDRMIKVS